MRVAVRRANGPPVQQGLALFDVELAPTRTVLDALLWIEEHLDPTLAFRRMCRSGICGTCSGLVNGLPRLFCQTLLNERSPGPPPGLEADVLVEPLPQFRVLKDLVVDIEPFMEELARVEAWLEPDPAYDGLVRPDVMEKLWPVAACVLCGICAERDDQPLPHAAATAKVLRLAADPRDAAAEKRVSVLNQFTDHDLRRVVHRLRAICPANVELEPLIRAVRSAGPQAE
jgi:succinate dehydrogenase / fumarate reductase iron-sulfur subunit